MESARNFLAANPPSSPSQIASSPAPLSENAKRKEKQTVGTPKPAAVEDKSERSSSEDEGEDEIDAEELPSDKITSTKRSDSVICAKKDPADLHVSQCAICPIEKGRCGHKRWMESRRAVRISFDMEDKFSSPISVPYAALTKTFSLIEATTKRLEKTAILTSFLLLVIQRSKKNDPKSLLQAVYLCINRVRVGLAT